MRQQQSHEIPPSRISLHRSQLNAPQPVIDSGLRFVGPSSDVAIVRDHDPASLGYDRDPVRVHPRNEFVDRRAATDRNIMAQLFEDESNSSEILVDEEPHGVQFCGPPWPRRASCLAHAIRECDRS